MKSQLDQRLALQGGRKVRDRAWPAWPSYDADTERALNSVLRSGRWTISGPHMGEMSRERTFARQFAEYCDSRYCTPVTSGTASLTIALLALGVGGGDEVLIPGLTWVACASATMAAGAVPVMVDIDPQTLAMSVDAARQAITERTAAVLLVHPYCRVADLEGFLALSKAFNIPLVEDCSQAHGARWRGHRVGSLGAIGCFSMQQSKVLTSGEGGAVVTNDRALYERMEQLRADGRMFAPNPQRGSLELVEVGRVQGHNFCLGEFQSALLLDRLVHLDEQNAQRRQFADALRQKLHATNLAWLPVQDAETEPTYYNLVLELNMDQFGSNSVDAVTRAMTAELGVQVSPVYRPMNQHPLYCPLLSSRYHGDAVRAAALDPTRFDLPNAQAVRERFITLPNWVLLAGEQGVEDIATALRKVAACREALEDHEQGVSTQAF
ncbi:DegT/DnrJ/EryC1/StrS family aminotransferase [Burkholderia thailandensis]|uniref:DegT/DnrJ/EryC1/StrS family aminotransferase n=1 Tax=Burkholderia thailandensis TaxID=57975 RepID=UPI001D015765|nr:DegT/DnrJ/EryC1/StrS family aminotransferase [Burkholderia thailandensis]MCZ2895468.1 DegT/DnrJ/EryC1/StrS family aminotransferase [Burkholderia thailandensis]